MVLFRDHEIDNAREWEDDTASDVSVEPVVADPVKKPSTAVILRINEVKNNRALLPIQQESAMPGTTSIKTTAVPGPHKREAVGSPSRPTKGKSRVQHRLRVPSIAHPRPWSRFNLITTAQTIVEQQGEQTARRAAQLRSLPHGTNFKAIGFLVWPVEDIEPDELFGNALRRLDAVRDKYNVFIDWLEDMRSLRLRFEDKTSVQQALAAVSAAVTEALIQSHSEDPFNIVLPPSPGRMKQAVTPLLREVAGPDKQGVIYKVLLAGDELSEAERRSWALTRIKVAAEQEELLVRSIRSVLGKLRFVTTSVRLRVHFGFLEITTYRKDFKGLAYSYDMFSRMLASKAHAHLNKCMGGPTLAENLISKINQRGDCLFEPDDFNATYLENVKEAQKLVIWVLAPSGETIRIETEIDTMDGSYGLEVQTGTTIFYREARRNDRLTIGVLNLEKKYDWLLQLSTTDEILDRRQAQKLQDLVQHTVRSIKDNRIDVHGFSYPNFKLVNNHGINILGVSLRSSRRYALRETCGHTVEISVYRNWHGTDTRSEPSINCGLTIFNQEWDDNMGTHKGPQARVWDPALNDLIEGGKDGTASLLGFLASVSKVQDFLDTLMDQPGYPPSQC